MKRSYIVLDVFTDVPLQGNQLAVFPDAVGVPTELMQPTAREMNLSETVFVLPSENGADADVRIFTPQAELPFAGHPVLGTGFVLGARLGSDLVRLRTGAGLVPIALRRDGEEIVFGEMEQPIPEIERFGREQELLDALGVERSEIPIEAYCNGPVHVCVVLESEEAVRRLNPDLGALAELGALNVSCFAVSGTRAKTRMFAPGIGVGEDPATGSAAGPLAIHLLRHGLIAPGQQLEIHQGAEIKRPSVLFARVEGSADSIERVLVGGSAVVVAEGEYRLA